eukprot:3659524-Rhodomonas_salina.1
MSVPQSGSCSTICAMAGPGISYCERRRIGTATLSGHSHPRPNPCSQADFDLRSAVCSSYIVCSRKRVSLSCSSAISYSVH